MIDPCIKVSLKGMRFNLKAAILSFMLGFFFLNFSLLENSTRQALAFSLFSVAIALSIFELLPDLFKRGKIKGILIGASILLYAFFLSEINEPYGEYGRNKYPYFMFVILMTFIAFPALFKTKISIELFSKLLFYISLFLCFFSILFADPNLGRRSEFGLNPAILARLCMISGIYITCVMYCKGVTIFRVLVLLLSIAAVFFTATKTPVPVFLLSFYLLIFRKINVNNGMKIFFGAISFLLLSYVVLVNFVPKEFSDRLLDPKSLSSERQSVEGNRFDLYQISLEILEDSVWGHGFGGFAKFHSFIVAPHNVILEISIELGIIITILFSLWVFSIFKKIKKIDLTDVNLLFLCTLFIYSLISSLFGGELTIQNFLLYLTGSILFLHGKKFIK